MFTGDREGNEQLSRFSRLWGDCAGTVQKSAPTLKLQKLHFYAVWCDQIHSKFNIQEITHLADVGSELSESTLHKAEVI